MYYGGFKNGARNWLLNERGQDGFNQKIILP